MMAAVPESVDATFRSKLARSWVAILFAVLLLLIVGVRFAQPIEDGDIF
jgi:hypothetical protein